MNMVMKKNTFLLLLGCLCLFTSCLKSGLDDIENSDLCTISSIIIEHRWTAKNANGYDQLCRQPLTLSKNSPDDNNEIRFKLTVPAASSSSSFSAFNAIVRNTVSLDNLYLISIISPAAKIAPFEGAPTLGLPNSFETGKDYKYQVTAANGTKAVFVIVIEDFVK